MTTHPFSLTAPATMTVAPDSTGTFTVTNSGTQALTVHESLGRYTPRTLRYPAADHATPETFGHPWLVIGPQAFTLAPGASKVVHVTSHVPAGTQGDHYLNAVWTASPAHATPGTLHLTGAVATTITIPEPGAAVPVTGSGLHAAPAAPVQHGNGVAGLALYGVLAAVLLIVVAILARNRMRRGFAG